MLPISTLTNALNPFLIRGGVFFLSSAVGCFVFVPFLPAVADFLLNWLRFVFAAGVLLSIFVKKLRKFGTIKI